MSKTFEPQPKIEVWPAMAVIILARESTESELSPAGNVCCANHEMASSVVQAIMSCINTPLVCLLLEESYTEAAPETSLDAAVEQVKHYILEEDPEAFSRPRNSPLN